MLVLPHATLLEACRIPAEHGQLRSFRREGVILGVWWTAMVLALLIVGAFGAVIAVSWMSAAGV
jgi:hypothetical protein